MTKAIEGAPSAPGSPWVLQGAYGGSLLAATDARAVWDAAAAREGHTVALVRSVPYLGNAKELRGQLFDPIAALLANSKGPAARAAALSALPWTG